MRQVSVKPGSVRIFNSNEKIVDWLRWADDDYIAARQLLLGDLLVQGAALANTAIEKYFKTILLIKKRPATKVHDIPRLFQELKKNGISLNLKQEFLDVLFKLYDLRYPDNLRQGFSIGIDRTRLLTELDFTVFEIRKGFKIVGPFGRIQSTVEELLALKDVRLLEKNCYFGSSDRATLFSEDAPRYAMRVIAPGFLIWAKYTTLGVPDTPNFKIEYPITLKGNKMEGKLPLE